MKPLTKKDVLEIARYNQDDQELLNIATSLVEALEVVEKIEREFRNFLNNAGRPKKQGEQLMKPLTIADLQVSDVSEVGDTSHAFERRFTLHVWGKDIKYWLVWDKYQGTQVDWFDRPDFTEEELEEWAEFEEVTLPEADTDLEDVLDILTYEWLQKERNK
jgi:hypothetical protein